MTDPPPYSNTGDDTRTPRWVKVSGIVLLVPVLLFVILLLTGTGGEHGPWRHMPRGAPGAHTPPSGPTERGAQQP